MSTKKKALGAIVLLLLIGGAAAWYLLTLKYDDTSTLKADFTVSALPFINEFKSNLVAANKKYSEKIILVNGKVSEVEKASDTTVNIKMTEPESGSYVIFAFQAQDAARAKMVKAGDSVGIKGSCSNGTFSEILETHFITFKRCALQQH